MIVLLLDVNTRSLRINVTATCAAGLKLTGYDSRKMCFIFFQLGLNISNWEKNLNLAFGKGSNIGPREASRKGSECSPAEDPLRL